MCATVMLTLVRACLAAGLMPARDDRACALVPSSSALCPQQPLHSQWPGLAADAAGRSQSGSSALQWGAVPGAETSQGHVVPLQSTARSSSIHKSMQEYHRSLDVPGCMGGGAVLTGASTCAGDSELHAAERDVEVPPEVPPFAGA